MNAGGETIRREEPASIRLFLAVAASAVFISVLTATMINVLIPLIRAQFDASAAQVGWVVTGYALAYAIGVPLYGRISDFFGVRGVFSVGLLGFAAGGLICAFAPSLTVLVLGRIVQGIGGAAIPALAIVSVAKVLPAGERGAGIGVIGSSLGVAAAVGPVVGGMVGQFLDWRALFVGTLALTLILIPFARRVLPNGGSGDERRFDLIGGLLLGLAAGLFLFGITQGQGAGFGSFSSWGSFLGAAISASLFVWRINGVSHPFVSPALFANRGYVAAVLVGFFAMLANLSALVLTPLLLIESNGLSPGAAGLVLTPGAVALALLSPLSGRLSDRIGVRIPILAGLMIMALSMLFISTSAAGAAAVVVSVGVLGLTIGMAFVQPPLTNAAAGALPDEEVGGGMGIFQGLLLLGGGTGPALIGAFLTAREETASDAINSLYTLDAAPFSDAFLAMVLTLIIALIAALGLRDGDKKDKQSEQILEGEALKGESAMNDELLARVEREVLGWDGVFKKRDEDGPGGAGVTGYRHGDPETGGPQIGHVHDDGHADFRFPREIRDELIRSGKAIAHPAFPNSRTTVSYRIRGTEDLPGALQLFRMNYERLRESIAVKARIGDEE